jgi:multiple sugar transport system substrate-binding protein
MAKTSKNPELAWALMRYLSTDTSALSKLENGLANIPPTNAATSASTTLPSQFKTFLTITQDPHVGTPPNTTIGSGQQDNFMTAWVRYQSGSGGDPISALKEADEATNNALALNTGP